MNTHIVTMSIDVDEETIRRKIEDHCAKEVGKKLMDNYLTSNLRYGDVNGIERIVKEVIVGILEQNKDYIIDQAIGRIVVKVLNSKAYKDKFNAI